MGLLPVFPNPYSLLPTCPLAYGRRSTVAHGPEREPKGGAAPMAAWASGVRRGNRLTCSSPHDGGKMAWADLRQARGLVNEKAVTSGK